MCIIGDYPFKGSHVSVAVSGRTSLNYSIRSVIFPLLLLAAGQAWAGTSFSITGPATATAGNNVSITVTASTGNYLGTVHFSSTDWQAGLPADYTFLPADNSAHIFSVTFRSSGVRSLSAIEVGNPAVNGTFGITVSPAAAAKMELSGPVGKAPGLPFSLAVMAQDAFGNTQPGYTGTVHFTSSDSLAALPADYTFVAGDFGAHTFSNVMLNTPGGPNQTVSATDTLNGTLTGSLTIATKPGLFAAAVNYGASNPTAICSADFNNDGKPDVVVTNPAGNSISLQLGAASGTLRPPTNFAAGTAPTAVAAGDLDRDGAADLVAANFSTDQISVLLGDGRGHFAAPLQFSTSSGPSAVAIGDMNGDGIPDLVVACKNSNSVNVLLGNGNGTFQAALNYPTDTAPASLVLSDVNNDGVLDVVTANAGSISILLGTGTGTLQAKSDIAAPNTPAWVIAKDLNADGKVDLAVALSAGNNVSILLGNGNGTFQSAVNLPAGASPVCIAAGDFNQDGKPDLAVADSTAAGISILLGTGGGAFGPPLSLATGSGPQALVAVDLNRDGRTDLAVANQGGNTVSVLLNLSNVRGTGTLVVSNTYPVGAAPSGLVAADFNADGVLDLAASNSGSNSVSVLLGNSNGSFQTAATYAASVSAAAISTGDLNGDGKPDLITVSSTNGKVDVELNNGNGTFQAPVSYAAGSNPLSVTVGDFDRTGGIDVVTANQGDSTLSQLPGNGNGTLQPAAAIPAGTNPVYVTAADLNLDGKLDLIFADTSSIGVLLATGSSFAPVASYNAGTTPVCITVSDFNADGIPDIAVANKGSANVSVLLGVGDGTFLAANNFAAGNGPAFLASGDFDGDGIPDLAVANSTDNTVSILIGKGNGSFKSAVSYPVGAQPNSLITGDFNADGILDLAVLNQAGNSVTVLFGQPTTGTHFRVVAPQNATVGSAFSPLLLALDPNNDVDTHYRGTVHFTSTDGQAVLPADYTFTANDSGSRAFNATLYTAGPQSLSVADTVISATTGSANVVVAKAQTTVVLTSSINPSAFSQTVNFAAHVAAVAPGGGTPAGTVSVFDGATLLGTGTLASGDAAFSIQTLAVGGHNISAQYAGNANYSSSTSPPLSQTVNKADQTITFGLLPDKVFGDAPFSLLAVADSDLAVSYTILSGPATLAGNKLTITGAGIVIVRASQPGDADFNAAADVDRQFVVAPASATVQLSNLIATYDGSPKSVVATVTPTVLVSITYNSSPNAPVNAGTYAVSAVVADPNFQGSATATLVIAKATPALTWTQPAAIVSGTPLGAEQLNATADTPGTFAYTPAAGTVLPEGPNQTLLAQFTPADTANYISAQMSLNITVVAPPPPVIVSGPTAVPNPPTAGKFVQLFCSVVSSSALSSEWDFGDGTHVNTTGDSVIHVYSPAGVYSVTFTGTDKHGFSVKGSLTLTVNPALISGGAAPAETDSDGDGFSDAVEAAAGTASNDIHSTPFAGASAGAPTSLPGAKMTISLQFAKTNSDSISVASSVLMPETGALNGQRITFNLGGVIRSYTLDASGAFKSASESLKLSGKSGARVSKFALKLSKGNFAVPLAAVGLANTDAKNAEVKIPLSVFFGNKFFRIDQPLVYSAKKGISGTAH